MKPLIIASLLLLTLIPAPQRTQSADIIFKKGEAEAKAMNVKAEAFQEYNQAAVIDKLLTGLPEVVRALASPLANVDKITVVSTGNGDSDFPLLTRHSFPGFSSTATNLLPGLGGFSVAYINTLVQLVLSPSVIADGDPAGTVVGAVSVASLLVGQYLPPTYSLPAAEAALRKALTIQEQLTKTDPGNSFFQDTLGETRLLLTAVLVAADPPFPDAAWVVRVLE